MIDEEAWVPAVQVFSIIDGLLVELRPGMNTDRVEHVIFNNIEPFLMDRKQYEDLKAFLGKHAAAVKERGPTERHCKIAWFEFSDGDCLVADIEAFELPIAALHGFNKFLKLARKPSSHHLHEAKQSEPPPVR